MLPPHRVRRRLVPDRKTVRLGLAVEDLLIGRFDQAVQRDLAPDQLGVLPA